MIVCNMHIEIQIPSSPKPAKTTRNTKSEIEIGLQPNKHVHEQLCL